MEATKQAILERLLPGERHVLAVAHELRIRESAIRRHFDQLEAAGLVTGFFRQEGLGRPKKYYRLTDSGHRRFPHEISEPVGRALQRVMSSGGAASRAEAVPAYLGELAAEVRLDEVPPTPLAQARVLERLLTRVGLATRARVEGERILVDHTGDVALRNALGRTEPLPREERDEIVRRAASLLRLGGHRVGPGRDLSPVVD